MKHAFLYLTLIFTFILGSHEGFVALWTQAGGDPAWVSPYKVSSLPTQDQKSLEQGIQVTSCQELHQLLEDLLS